MRGTKFSSAANPTVKVYSPYVGYESNILCRLYMTGGIFRDDLWCVTEMHLVNSEAVIRLDTRKHSIGAPEE